MNKLPVIKSLIKLYEGNPPVEFYLRKFEVKWLIKQADKAKEQQEILRWIVDNFDSDKSGLSDEEYHKQMLKMVNDSLRG